VRLKVPQSGTVRLHDAVRGQVTFDFSTIDDSVLLKSDGMATYHLAAMVDDHDMKITHIFRTEEWLPSSPKHLLIFQAMEWSAPIIAHLPLLLTLDGKKLSKRIHGEAVWLRTYRDAGYLPEVMINYLVLLGWNPGGDREYFTKDELVEAFSLDRVHKAGAKFDQAKLDAFQQHYVKQLSVAALVAKLSAFLVAKELPVLSEPMLTRIATVIQPRLGKFANFPDLTNWAVTLGDYSPDRLVFRKSTPVATQQGVAAAIESLTAAAPEIWESVNGLSGCLAQVVVDQGLTNGDVFWPVRVGLTGLEQSPSPAECLWVLGRDESLRRLAAAFDRLTNRAV